MTITTLILESDDVVPVLIEFLTVRLFDTGGSFVTSGVTDVDGEVIVDVPDADYDLYFFKSGVSILGGMPQRITVDAADTDVPPNTFKVLAHVAVLPEAVDPALCRVSGDLVGSGGQPSIDGRLVFSLCKMAGYIVGDLLAPQSALNKAPDAGGHYEFDLIRGQEYQAWFTHVNSIPGIAEEPFRMKVIVPDLPSIHIRDLLFPVPVSATFSALTLGLVAGGAEDNTIELTVTYSDGSDRTALPALGTQFILSSDNDVAVALDRVENTLYITPIAAGVANITVSRVLSTEFLVFDPTPAFITETLEVTVT